jgi:hypothetical protein
MGEKPDLSPEKRNVGCESDSKENEPEGEEVNEKNLETFVKRDFCIFSCSWDIVIQCVRKVAVHL